MYEYYGNNKNLINVAFPSQNILDLQPVIGYNVQINKFTAICIFSNYLEA